MKLSFVAAASALLPGAVAWGSLGHITTAYIASRLVSNTTEAFFQTLLRNETEAYLAGVATWADSIRYTKWGRFTSTFHFIDAKDSPPTSCSVDLARDCKATGCVVTSLANYTSRLLDPALPMWERAQAAKFVIHFVGDIHQPLHNEDIARGGNGIKVLWKGSIYNLHSVWDSAIAEMWIGEGHRPRRPYEVAARWADDIVSEFAEGGKFGKEREGWLDGIQLDDAEGTALMWSRESNALVCSTVLPEGVAGVAGKELTGAYYEKAGPEVERQVARGGYRLAAWLDLIAERGGGLPMLYEPEPVMDESVMDEL